MLCFGTGCGTSFLVTDNPLIKMARCISHNVSLECRGRVACVSHEIVVKNLGCFLAFAFLDGFKKTNNQKY